jgi:hypothetical protein
MRRLPLHDVLHTFYIIVSTEIFEVAQLLQNST